MPRRLPRTTVLTGTLLGTGVALLAAVAPAVAATTGATRQADGLHLASGAILDPAGRTWVADHNAGFCRVSPAGESATGTIEHPQRPGQAGPRTCLGGLLPDAAPGPDAAGQPVFLDPTPDRRSSGDELAFIPDGASPSSEVVRARWNPNSERFEFLDTITMNGDKARPTALSVGPDGAVYVGFQREGTIQRIVAPGTATPIVETVGRTSAGTGAQSVAAGRGADGAVRVYVAEAAGLRALDPDPAAPPLTTAVPYPLGGSTIGAMFYDGDADQLYVGTADGATQADAGRDRVLRIDIRSGAVDPTYATGFSMIGGMGAAGGGNVFVTDDPALLDPAEPLGTGRLFHVGLPAAHVTAGPLDDSGATGRDRHTADRTPRFEVSGDGPLECLLSGGASQGVWAGCGEDGTFQVNEDLADGAYRLAVRATRDGRQGLPEVLTFSVDTKSPLRPVIARPADDGVVGSAPWFEFTAERGATFACVIDGGEEVPCSPGRTASFRDAGEHSLQVIATDAAGNRSEPSAVKRFTVDPGLAPAPAPGWGAGPPSHKGSSLHTTGLHLATGAVVDPNGRVWVSDHNGGFCRTTPPGEDGAGAIEHPSVAGDPGARTCLGGLLPEAGTGPDAAGQPAYVDPTPEVIGNGDEVVLIPDAMAQTSDVHRVKWNPESGLFEYLDAVTMTGDRVRPTAAATGPDGSVYVIFQRSATVQRITDPAGASPAVSTVGNASGPTTALAVGSDPDGQVRIFLGQDTALTTLQPNATRVPTATATAYDLGTGASVGALAYDSERHDLYVGTSRGTTAGADVVHRIATRTGAVERDWLTGYSMIGGLALRPDGVLFVLDDPALLDPAEPLGTGRVFHVGLPAAHVASPRAAYAVRRPELTIAGEERIQCRLRGPEELDTGYVGCEAGTWQPAADLADGDYRLSVRSVAGTDEAPITGLVEMARFAVDTVAPTKPRIATPVTGATTGAAPWFTFAGDDGVSFECRWSVAEAFTACEPGYTRRFDVNGPYTLEIRAVDAAGNVSEISEPVSFDARGRVGQVTIEEKPAAVTAVNTATFRFSADAIGVQFACRLGDGAFTSCTTGKTYTNLADGDHAFEVKGIDESGNVSPVASHRFRVDTVRPVVTLAGVSEGEITGPDVTVSFVTDEPATLRCRIDGADPVACERTARYTGLAAGIHTFEVVATDEAGNVGRPVSRRFAVAVPAPVSQPPVTPVTAVKPVTPPVQVIDQRTQRPRVSITGYPRRLKLATLRRSGMRVQVRAGTGTAVVRVRIRTATARPKVIATVLRKVKAGDLRLSLTPKDLRKLSLGRYAIEVAAGSSQSSLGAGQAVSFRVVR